MPRLDPTDPPALDAWLRARRLLADDERLTGVTSTADDRGVTVRAALSSGRVLLVEQAPADAPSPDGVAVEVGFRDAVSDAPDVAEVLPPLRHVDLAERVLVVEPPEHAAPCTDVYAGRRVDPAELDALLGWLDALHALRPPRSPTLANRGWRARHHVEVFVRPFQPDPGVDLDAVTPGLGDLAARLRADDDLLRRVGLLGSRYLADGPHLLHGDLHPGAWLRTPQGLRIVRPSGAYLGSRAWDRGVVVAHLLLSGHDDAVLGRALDDAPPRTLGFAGVEVLARLLGRRQLPLPASALRRAVWADVAADWIRED